MPSTVNLMSVEVIGSRGEPTVVILLNGHIVNLLSKFCLENRV